MRTIYKGYLKGKGKKTVEKFKEDPSTLVKYNTARQYDSYVGVLDDDYVMIDIDSIEESDLLLDIIEDLDIKCSVLETTQGIHVYFKGYDLTANKVDWFSPIGIKVTAKLGCRNTVDPLKIDGKSRPWIIKSKEHDPLPKWLYPMSRKENHVQQISEGSRNQELFNYILKLQSTGMSKQEIKDTIRIINKYILDDPLPEQEVEVIIRDEAFMKESFFQKSKFLHDKFAMFLIQEHHIIRIVDVLHVYKDGVYSDRQADIERAMIKHLPMLTKTQRAEVLAYLQLKAPMKKLANEKYVALNNGILNIDDWQLQDFDPAIIIKNKIPINYREGAYYEVTDNALNKLAVNDKELRTIFEEIFGYILLRRNEIGKAFILTGDGKNGKSTFLKMIRAFVGQENTSSLDLKEIGKQFKTAELFGKLMNIGDDISSEYIKDNSEFKKVTTGEYINVERKGKDPFDFQNYAKLIFSANKMPRINDTSSGLTRRLMIIPFNATFSPEDDDYDPFIQDKLISDESMEYMLILAINGLKRLLHSKSFSYSKQIEIELTQYEELNNPIIAFLKEEPKLINESTLDVFMQYQSWAMDNGFKAVGKTHFSREVCRMKKLTTKNVKVKGEKNKVIRVFTDIVPST